MEKTDITLISDKYVLNYSQQMMSLAWLSLPKRLDAGKLACLCPIVQEAAALKLSILNQGCQLSLELWLPW